MEEIKTNQASMKFTQQQSDGEENTTEDGEKTAGGVDKKIKIAEETQKMNKELSYMKKGMVPSGGKPLSFAYLETWINEVKSIAED